MLYGDNVAGKHCARCADLLTLPIVYRDSLWFHQRCWLAGVEQLRNATRLAASSLPTATDYPLGFEALSPDNGREVPTDLYKAGRGKRAVWSWIARHRSHASAQHVTDNKFAHRAYTSDAGISPAGRQDRRTP